MLNPLSHASAGFERRRTGRSLAIALVVSIALHAALLAFVPGLVAGREEPVRLAALEVTLRTPAEPLPVAAVESAPQRAQLRTVRQAAKPAPAPREISPTIPDSRTPPDAPVGVALSGSSEAPAAPSPASKMTAAAQAVPASQGATYLDNPAPRYPDAARRLGQEGTVMLRVLVTVDGAAGRVALERSSGSPHLDGAALERVRNWRFRPAWQGAAPVESWVIVPIVFRLESAS